ncbi:MAG: mechanosensitive ion channel [Thermoanaerobaculia bacterium]|nr:mechanosensitive ion channel [Thermoanaerobaculia bacterium]
MSFVERLVTVWEDGRFLFDIRLFEISGTAITVATLLTFLVILLVTLWLSRLAQRAVLRGFGLRGKEDEGTAAVSARLIRYTVLLVGFSIAIHNLGINLTGLFAAGALFAVALGFAMQNISQNFVSGVILLLERAIKPGDVLEVEGMLVRVREMGIRATVARTLDEEDIIIPNSQLVSSSVKNYTYEDSSYRLRTTVGVHYGSDLRLVFETLQNAARELPWRADTPAPRVLLLGFGSSSVDFDVSVWIDDPWSMRSRRSLLNEAVWWSLKEAGVTIAFPQVDVHFDPPYQVPPLEAG